MNKRDTKKVLRDIKVRLENIMEMEEGIDYYSDNISGEYVNSDEFADSVSNVFGSIKSALEDVKVALKG